MELEEKVKMFNYLSSLEKVSIDLYESDNKYQVYCINIIDYLLNDDLELLIELLSNDLDKKVLITGTKKEYSLVEYFRNSDFTPNITKYLNDKYPVN